MLFSAVNFSIDLLRHHVKQREVERMLYIQAALHDHFLDLQVQSCQALRFHPLFLVRGLRGARREVFR